MNRLPMEIWREVFTHACTDGGYTGMSLTLVCRFFYNASLPIRFRSLSFRSLHQIELFLHYARRYEESHAGAKLRVHHLMLSFPNTSADTPESSPASSPGADANDVDQWVTSRRLREEEKAAWDDKFTQVLPELFELVAPHLRTLALLQSDGFTLPPIRNVLPRLRELTLLVGISVMLNGEDGFQEHGRSCASHLRPHGSESPEDADVSDGVDENENVSDSPGPTEAPICAAATPSLSVLCARFPALERLHVVCGRHRDFRLRDTLAHLPRLAPKLTHLRISNATYTHEACIPDFLRAALGMPCPEFAFLGTASPPRLVQRPPGADPDIHAALPALRNVVVHSVLPPAGGACGNPYMEYVALMDAVNAIGAACEATEAVRVRAVRSDRAKHRHWEELVARQWVERIEGGYGCWVGCEAE
ncbi:hypothetical protein GY45DRAFT_495512 [Cubamyces sp. BRFM 1775]|nr:hypothetical protein GY45DRAFT_495512 [Cubamyces sp. BRFM 1775]